MSEADAVMGEVQVMRSFNGGATRNVDVGKLDFEGFLSPHVLKRYAEYLQEHQTQADGKLRASDNWQKGIPLEVYMKSELRHVFDQWKLHREQGYDTHPETRKLHEDACCAVVFNALGYLFELLQYKAKNPETPPKTVDPTIVKWQGELEAGIVHKDV